jgi:hypothetical protein
MPKLQEKPSALKREHPALQKMKILSFFYFLGSFLPSWSRIRIRNLYADPDPAAQINADPDPKPWIRVREMVYRAPTPQAGRVTDSDGGGRVRVGVRGQGPPSLMGSLYRNTKEVTAIYNRLVKSSPM